ncbi:putative P-loop containing nucleoside triphosphate hydrolase, leucine-rich repeat domain, L [Rosa chinensis]|uniref:Putative P-loop containing nucleoside triphosphate hydrolase, leucine-rich repeat domain, L n=1 Tax=Rosa chinensis TaxID=74649 RepID=A0A2P6RRE5_ROSCH|nr:disease resistance protein RGA2 isoform X1 [Rosa chinensis]XP_024180720.1 disease resistance protein RGA2 isoform X1 [Rosa chinensis]XP_024180721.1 disease resistance protein RGA2 isoform X1 [Rosa chinensis]XP_040370214.1 disease resistance protein RGA2 isoform X1 [Rosa chinensis]XP_040370215.1 disease resistance protein RGA2 isoform X1 [Rosa chinensis]XP_040370216.1 disease resistance protein RGA2 isoform X1 [Rosa chinensis]PRQ48999.1 putative P-loop containing nucleoside triphosphate hyd
MEFASSIAENVLDRLASHASQEISLAWGAQLELTKLDNTLSTIKLVLEDAEKKQVRNPLITRWLGNLKDVCHDVDDVLDKLDFQKLRLKVEVDNCGKIKGKVRQFFSRWNPVLFNFRMGHKVKEIRERLVEIDNEKREFGLIEVDKIVEDHHAPQGMHDNERETDSLLEATDVIGRDNDKKQIISHLLNNSDISSEENVYVISILGLGGLGKTTLSKLVYNDRMVEENFQMKMWVCVSENFDIRTLIRGIINAAIGQKCEDESLDLMKKRLQNTFRDRKFLLVLDDVWDTELIGITIEKWNDLKGLLNVGANGSKIIITTRHGSVASLVNPVYMHPLEGLPHKDCISLFIKRAFKRGGEEQRYQHLIEIGEDIVKKCGGVPLAVATVGSMLYLNRERHHWLCVRDDDMWSIGNDNILSALKLSYDALPRHLKPCFAFCSLFPKDYEFNSEMLIPLWMAQGYLKTSKKNEDLDQMGIDYIRQCCSRSLFQVDMDLKTFISFKIHDLLHDLAILVAQVEYSTVNFRPSSAFEMVRHMSISKNDLLGEEAQVPDFMLKSKKLRTIRITRDGEMNQHFVKTCISRFKYMRVLDIGGSPLEELPSSIGSLFHLRFLDLSGNRNIKRLPNSISKLLNMETLSLENCDALEEIPKDIGNLINLRSLTITTQQTYLPKGIRRLTSLQSLSFVGCVNLKSLGEEIQFLNNLRKLAICSCDKLESLPPNMKHMTALDTLGVGDCEKLQLMRSGEGPRGLRSLIIENSSLEALPPWLIEDSADTLQSIYLGGCHNLTALPELIKFTFLEELHIEVCSKLSALLPQGLHCLTELRELKIEGCPELSKSCKRQLKGEEWSKMARQVKITLDDSDDEADNRLADGRIAYLTLRRRR